MRDLSLDPGRRPLRAVGLRLVGALLALLAAVAAAAAETPDAALQRLLADARAQTCGAPGADALVRVLCTGTLRVGVRSSYPLFAEGRGDGRTGYDVDVARAVAGQLGVAPAWVDVRAATRISTLAEGGADVVVATMGHNTRRDAEARFIRPHYYRSETIVVGGRDSEVTGWDDLAGRALCATIGNYANAQIVSENVRLMLFEDAARLPAALRDGSCLLAAQDDSFFASFLADPASGARFERKFGFDPVPWGMAVPLSGSERLAQALDLLSQVMHRDGTFLAIARANEVPTAFLEQQQALWRTPACADAAAIGDPACVLSALDATPPPTRFAPEVERVVAFLQRTFGTSPELPMLTSVPAWELFRGGVFNSLVLVLGAIAATLAFALLFGRAAASSRRIARILAWAAITTIQSSPVVLTLVVASALAQALFTYSGAVAIGAAVLALGLMNGCNAGQAIGEAAASLRREGLARPPFRAAVGRSLTQLLSFLVNAAKGTPIASFTGAPELLSALTDITSFAAGRVTTYTLVLLFYIAVVAGVVFAGNRVRARLERRLLA